MHKLTNGLRVALTAILFTASAPFFHAQAQENSAGQDTSSAALLGYAPAKGALFEAVPEDLIIDRMSCLQKEIKLTYNSKVKGFIDYFTIRNRRYLHVMESRRNVFFPIFEEYLKKHKMPDELKYLAIVESGLNPKASSRVGAAGLWQFMPATGKMYNLRQDQYLDERLDPYLATEAACKYLKQLYNIFDDWELALASYNCGPGNIRRAIRKSGYKDNFWEVYNFLPQETRSYVPQFVAITYVMNHLNEYNFRPDSLLYPVEFDTVYVSHNLNLDKFSSNLGICKEDLQRLNPGLKRDVLPAYLNYPLRVPSDVISVLHSNRLAIMDSSKASEEQLVIVEKEIESAVVVKTVKVYHKVKKGESLGKIAAKYNVSTAELKKWNRLKSNTVQVGQSIAIVKQQKVKQRIETPVANTKTPEQVAANKSSNTEKNSEEKTEKQEAAKEYKSSIYVVKSGDNLQRIAENHDITIAELKDWNNLSGSVIKVGQKLTIKKDTTAESETAKVEKKEEPSTEKPATPVKSRYYIVKSGDNLQKIATKYEITVADLKNWNKISGSSIQVGQRLAIYKEHSEVEIVEKEEAPAVTAKSTHYIVKKGDNLHAIAQKYDVTVADLKEWNGISGTALQVGQKLTIRSGSSEKAVAKSEESLPKVYYVQPGDTLWSISKKHNGISVEEIKKKNNLKDGQLKPGMKLIIG